MLGIKHVWQNRSLLQKSLDFSEVDYKIASMQRRIFQNILNDLDEKIILLSGPRQVGKTTLAQSLDADQTYLNYDVIEHRKIISAGTWAKDTRFVILDELHKMANWKQFLKGLYDLQKAGKANKQKILVTGSARLDISRKMGDSLAGRHFSYTLNPLTIKELMHATPNPMHDLLEFSGYPEPFFRKDKRFYRRWQMSHLDIILRQDLIDLEQVRNITKIELLVELLRDRVGSPCSYSSLAEDLQVSPATVKNWLTLLERLYVVFKITPYQKNIARSLLKTPKFYFYDLGRVVDPGARFENLVALSLKSEIDLLRDTEGRRCQLHYLRDRDGHEIDFLIVEEKAALLAIEAKTSDPQPDRSFRAFFGPGRLACKNVVQLVAAAIERREYNFGLKVEPAEKWLKTIVV